MQKQSTFKPRKKHAYSPLQKSIFWGLLIVLGLVAIAFFFRHHNNQPTPSTAQTTSKAPTAQNTYKGGDTRQPNSNGVAQGGAIDTKGTSTTPTSSQGTPTSSDSGVITLNTPTNMATIQSGVTLAGASSQSGNVQYRLVDDKVGVIAQGQLSVVSGKFSGRLQFTSYGTTGTLAVFTFDPQTGAETNSVRIAVKF